MSVIVSYGCWLSLTVSQCAIDLLHFSYFLLSLLVISHYLSGQMEFVHVSHCLLSLLSISHCLSCPIKLLHVSHCLLWLLAVSQSLSQFNGVCMSLTVSYRRYSLSLPVPWSCLLSFTLLLAVSLGLFQFQRVAACLSMSPTVCGSLSYLYCPMELLHVSHFLICLIAVSCCLPFPIELQYVFHCLLWLLAVYHCLFQFHRVFAYHSQSPIVAGCLSLSLQSHGVAKCVSLSLIVAG